MDDNDALRTVARSGTTVPIRGKRTKILNIYNSFIGKGNRCKTYGNKNKDLFLKMQTILFNI